MPKDTFSAIALFNERNEVYCKYSTDVYKFNEIIFESHIILSLYGDTLSASC